MPPSNTAHNSVPTPPFPAADLHPLLTRLPLLPSHRSPTALPVTRRYWFAESCQIEANANVEGYNSDDDEQESDVEDQDEV